MVELAPDGLRYPGHISSHLPRIKGVCRNTPGPKFLLNGLSLWGTNHLSSLPELLRRERDVFSQGRTSCEHFNSGSHPPQSYTFSFLGRHF